MAELVTSVRAPAKVNLILKILDRQSNGYHRLWSLMQTVELEDDLVLHIRPNSSDIRLQCRGADLPTDRGNLIYQAAELVLTHAGKKVGVDIDLQKRIPMAAGLGGGSSDAVATIVGLNHLLGLGWSLERMAQVGATLGSDLPFFFFSPSAVVRGWGQEVKPVVLAGRRWIVLVNPGFPIQTKWAYEQVTASRRSVPPLSATLEQLPIRERLSWEEIIPLMANDFEPALFPIHPGLAELKAALVEAGAERALLSGSGATVFGIFRDEMTANRARDFLAPFPGRSVYVVRSGSSSEPQYITSQEV